MEPEALDTRALTIALDLASVDLVAKHEEGNDPSTQEPILDDEA